MPSSTPGRKREVARRGRTFGLPKVQFGKSPLPWNPVACYYLILFSALTLGMFGLLMGFSATSVTNIAQGVNPYVPFGRTAVIALLSLLVASVAARVPFRGWDRAAMTLFAVALTLQLMLIPYGVGESGNVNWLPIPGTGGQVVQPSEFLKLATALAIARLLSSTFVEIDNWKHIFFGAGIPTVLAAGSVMLGADLGTALIFVVLALGALWVAGMSFWWFGVLGIGTAGLSIFLVTVNPSRTRRVIEFISGQGTPLSTSAPTQTDHGLWALGSGGLMGLGPGASRAKWDYLQEAHTDFILAIVGEEFGLIGTLTLLALFGVLAYGTLQLAANSKSGFVRVASGGIAAWLIFQALINVGTVTGLMPVIGVPFPLISYGGSSFLFTAMAIGVLLSFARAEAGMSKASKFSVDTGGRDPRRTSKSRHTNFKNSVQPVRSVPSSSSRDSTPALKFTKIPQWRYKMSQLVSDVKQSKSKKSKGAP